MPAEVIATGNRFFDLNFRDGAYGTKDAAYNFAFLTTIMAIFGSHNVPIQVG